MEVASPLPARGQTSSLYNFTNYAVQVAKPSEIVPANRKEVNEQLEGLGVAKPPRIGCTKLQMKDLTNQVRRDSQGQTDSSTSMENSQ